MLGSTEAVTVEMVRMALDATSLRHQAIANNIANINTKGYAPARVDFEQQMSAVRQALDAGQPVTHEMLSGIQPVLQRDQVVSDEDRTSSLDTESANLAQNTVQYEALLKALGKHFAILGSAISEGKR